MSEDFGSSAFRRSAGAPGKTADAIDFLKLWEPHGRWIITTIVPDGNNQIATRTFHPEDEKTLFAFIDEAQGKANIYFTVNRTSHDVSKKPIKKDIAFLNWLHVDIDPRPFDGKNPTSEQIQRHFETERARILEKVRAFDPPPTAITDSGGGYQVFFRLEDPRPTNGDEAVIVGLEAYNRQLEHLVGGDHCFNIDRIMRLPGTINIPDQRKKKKGRKPALASVVEFNGHVYPLSRFIPASSPQRRQEPDSGINPEPIGDNLPPVALDSLPDTVLPSIKALIMHGHDPDTPGKYPSRSEPLYRVTLALLRAGCDARTITSILLDKDYGISESVLENKRPDKYAARQIERAQTELSAEGGDPVSFINQRYFAALEGGKVAFYREEPDGTVETMQSAAFDFELGTHVVTTVDKKIIPYTTIWKKSANRRYYCSGFVLSPEEPDNKNVYNLWKGFGVRVSAGDWARLRNHIYEVLANGDKKLGDYIVNWTAWTVQNPATPARVALVFKGGEGVGKGVFCNALVKAFGVHGMRVQSMDHLVGRFNAHLRLCCLLYGDEVSAPDSNYEGTLKGLITEPTMPIERKGVDVVQAENHLHVVMASNNDWIVPAGIGARRFAVFRVSDRRKGDRQYFADLYHEIENGGLGAMIHELLSVDLSGWHPESARPETAELSKQKAQSLGEIDKIWLDVLLTGTAPTNFGGEPYRPLSKEGAYLLPTNAFVEVVRRATHRNDITANKVAAMLDGFRFVKRTDTRPRGYEIPPLAAARARWDELQFVVDWDDASEWQFAPASC